MTICGTTGLSCVLCDVPCLPRPTQPEDGIITLSSRQMIYRPGSIIERLDSDVRDVLYPLGMTLTHAPMRDTHLAQAISALSRGLPNTARYYLNSARLCTPFDVR